ncbi:MAG: BON domain-containing protein [Candidatus Heimdallarchaeota archaeon]|nr:BON domain-containing protein [Candidatus Heimdallarchaeota archaeon]
MRDVAELDVWAIANVLTVENNLEVEHPEGYAIPSDVEIKENVERRLTWDPSIDSSKIDISVQAGVVTLEGTTMAYWKKKKVERIISDISGVTNIINKLAIVPTRGIADKDIVKDIMAAMERNHSIDPRDITVKVKKGQVKLTGKVSTWKESRVAEECAELTRGVTDVTNNIKIKG